jgi:hypothetical protein
LPSGSTEITGKKQMDAPLAAMPPLTKRLVYLYNNVAQLRLFRGALCLIRRYVAGGQLLVRIT